MTPASRGHFPPAPRPVPKPLDELSRPQLAARLHVLREAVDALFGQSDLDRGEAFRCIGAMRVAEQELEHRLGVYGAHGVMPPPSVTTEQIAEVVVQQLHRAAARDEPLAAAVTSPAAEQRLRQAGADLSEVVREIAIDSARALANVAARHRTQALAETARIRELSQPRQGPWPVTVG